MRLRTRLVVLVVSLAALGLGAAGVAGNLILHRLGMDRVDDQLAAFGGRVGGRALPRGVTVPGAVPPPEVPVRCDGVPPNLPGTLFELYDADATPVCAPGSEQDPGGGPRIGAAELARADERPFTVAGRNDGHEYRVLVRPGPRDTVAVLSIDLEDMRSTWRRQELATAGVGAGLLALVALGAVLLVRRELRPLEDVTEAADTVAAGDLSHRVAPPARQSEVGRLAVAFNTMIDRIERSFQEQRASEERIRRFAADASHELRTPLASIQGFAEMHSGRSTGDAAHDLAWRRVDTEAHRLSGLVEDLLALARHDQGTPVRRDAVDLVEVVTAAVTDARAASPGRAFTVSAPAELLVLGDARQLNQVVVNLVANAVAHTPAAAAVEVHVDDATGRPELRVVDHGPGISAEDRMRVFERFVRLDSSRSRASGGSGLGLAIVDALVAGHGGRVWIEDTPGGGATVVVALPEVGAGDGSGET